MIRKGQIVEIPSSSAIYTSDKTIFSSKKEELLVRVLEKNYGLFDGFLVGEHQGVEHFKLGQRKGINVGGKNAPLYVIGINEENNQLFVGEGENHPGLWTQLIDFHKNHIRLDLDLMKDQWEIGMNVSINSSILENKMYAILYVFDDRLFLEFESPVSISIQEHPIEIILTENPKSTNKIIK